jgi:carbon monoxide dehydrogenase subunit G
MKISGSNVVDQPVDKVWEALLDPRVLVATIPGCERLVETGDHAYDMTVTAGVAAIKGTYDGTVELLDPEPPGRFRMKASGAGGPGTVDADVVVNLAPGPDGGTTLTYDADATVGGVIGGVGQRMLTGVTRKMATQFFSAVDDDIAGVRKPAKPEKVPAPAVPTVPAEEVPAAARPIPPVTVQVPPFVGVKTFAWGAVSGAAIALAGVIVGWLIGGR